MDNAEDVAHNSDKAPCGVADAVVHHLSTNERLNALAGHLNAVHAAIVELVADALADESWGGEGVRTPQQWLSWQLGISTAEAHRFLDLAKARETHPKVTGRFAADALSLTQASIATSVDSTRDAEIDELVTACTVNQLRLYTRSMRTSDHDARERARKERAKERADRGDDTPPEDVLPDPDPRDRRSNLEFWYDDHGRMVGRFDLDPEDSRILEAGLRHARDLLFHERDDAADLVTSLRVTGRWVNWAAALVEMARRSVDADESPSRRERFRINLFLDPTVKPQAEWSDRMAVPRALLDKLTCDGTLTPTFVESGKPVSVGRALRTVPDRTRRLVLYRDHHKCRIPWCERTRWLDVHHIKHWAADRGDTDTDNLMGVCDHCHDAIHRGDLLVHGNADEPDGLTFSDRDGNVIEYRTPVPATPAEPCPAPERRYIHPLGEELDHSNVWVRPSKAG
jgi:hypothetical protein